MGIRLSDHFTYKKLLRFVLPSIAMMVFISVYGVVDGFFVSNFAGKTSFAAINLVMPFVMLLGGIGFMVGTGGTALVSKVLGEGNREKANRYFSMMVFLTLLLGVLLTAVGIAAMEPVARFLGATDAMIADSVLYGRIVVGFTTAFMLQNVFQSFLIAAEKPKLGLLATIAAGLTNILLDALFVGGFGWGVAGAAIATVLAQLISTVACFLYAFSRYPELRLHREDFAITKSDLSQHIAQGVPLGLQFSVLSVGIITMQSVVVQFDMQAGLIVSNAAQNGFGAANKLHMLTMTPLNAFGTALTSFTAQNLGAGKHERIRRGAIQASIIMALLAALSAGAGLLMTIGDTYFHVFLSADKVTPETIRYGNAFLYVDYAMYLLLGGIFLMRNCDQGIGRSQFTLAGGAAELVARIAVSSTLPAAIAGGVVSASAPSLAFYALCAADPAAWLATDIILAIPFIKNILRQDYRYLYGEHHRRKAEKAL